MKIGRRGSGGSGCIREPVQRLAPPPVCPHPSRGSPQIDWTPSARPSRPSSSARRGRRPARRASSLRCGRSGRTLGGGRRALGHGRDGARHAERADSRGEQRERRGRVGDRAPDADTRCLCRPGISGRGALRRRGERRHAREITNGRRLPAERPIAGRRSPIARRASRPEGRRTARRRGPTPQFRARATSAAAAAAAAVTRRSGHFLRAELAACPAAIIALACATSCCAWIELTFSDNVFASSLSASC